VLIRELLQEGEITDDMNNNLMDFVITYHSKNKPWAPMSGEDGAVTYMRKLGHDVTADDLMKLLSGPMFADIVERSGPKNIKIKTGIPDTLSDKSAEKEAETIAKTADKQAEKAVKSGELEL
jgi:hypothetical protein